MVTLAWLISLGDYLMLPSDGSISIGQWQGCGYVDYYGGAPGVYIDGNYSGGWTSTSNAIVNPALVAQFSQTQPKNNVSTPHPKGADPVDLTSGAFQIEQSPLSLGRTEPRGINYTSSYDSTRRSVNVTGMGPGWFNSYFMNATTMCAPQASTGGTTPAQAAAIIAATAAALGIHNGVSPDPKNWMVTALIAKWGADQIVNNGVSVTLGKDIIQFVKQPNGVFTPPGNCTMTLLQTNGAYWLGAPRADLQVWNQHPSHQYCRSVWQVPERYQ